MVKVHYLSLKEMLDIVQENLDDKLKYCIENNFNLKNELKERSQNFSILKKDEIKFKKLRNLLKNIKKEGVKFGESKYLVQLQFSDEIQTM